MPHHPQIAIAADGSVTAAWDESVSGSRRAVIGRGDVDAAGRMRFTRHIVSDVNSAVYPVIAESASGTVVAWTKGGTPSTIRIVRLER
jgi:hypothetical protein